MTFNRNLIAVIVLVLIATSLLISSLDYASGIIGSRGGRPGPYSYSGAEQAPTNSTPGPQARANQSLDKNGENATGLTVSVGSSRGPGGDNSPSAVQDSGSSLLIISLIALALDLIAAIAFVIIRKRRRRNVLSTTSLPAETIPAVPAPAPDSFEGRYRLRFPRIREPFPNTWGVDEPLELAISCKDGATGEVLVSIDGEEARKVLLENGRATVSLKLKKGDHKVTVSGIAAAGTSGDSWVNVRIVDYREEIVRMFNALCRRFNPADDGAGDELTPRELERSVGTQMPETKRRQLDAAVTTFELANYSLHEIQRPDFERMYTSEMGIQ